MTWLKENAPVILSIAAVLILHFGVLYYLHADLGRKIERVEDRLTTVERDVSWIKGRIGEKGNVKLR